MMEHTFECMLDIARRRGNRSLVWAMEHGVFDEYDYNDRALIRERIRDGR
jgi:hypothetical protein